MQRRRRPRNQRVYVKFLDCVHFSPVFHKWVENLAVTSIFTSSWSKYNPTQSKTAFESDPMHYVNVITSDGDNCLFYLDLARQFYLNSNRICDG